MVNISGIIHKVSKFATDNSPIILTSAGVAGTIATAILTGKAAWNSAIKVVAEEEAIGRETGVVGYLTPKEKFKLVWTEFIPAVSTGAVTITSIILANRIGTKRAAALAAAYTVSEKAFSEYRDKVVDRLGQNKEREVRDEIAQDRVTANATNKSEVYITGNGEQMCYDVTSDRMFKSTVENIKKAQNDINYQLLQHDYASLNEFYDHIGLPHIKFGDQLGWTSMQQLELQITSTLLPNGQPAIAVDFYTEPIRDYDRSFR